MTLRRSLLFVAPIALASCTTTNTQGVQRGQPATAVAVGGAHACVRITDGTLRCWGKNSAGQLGDDTTEDRASPVIVTGSTGISDFTLGFAHTCGVWEDGAVRCWGANDFGQLGDGTNVARHAPVILPAISHPRAIAAGGAHTCAIRDDRSVWCWGRNEDGQLGDGSTTSRLTPVRVNGLGEADAIVLGTFHTCAKLVDGSVRCWGRNDSGQLGDGTNAPRPIPINVLSLTGVTQLAVSLDDSCSLGDLGFRCWGRSIGHSNATPVIGWANLAEVSIGASSESDFQVCARITDGSIRCAGSLHEAPTLVPGITNDAQIAVGSTFACARLLDASIRCWARGQAPVPVVP